MAIIEGEDRLSKGSCKLCGSSNVDHVSDEHHADVDYAIAYCRDCDVVQTAGVTAPVSPEYVTLSDEAIDEERIWCQGAHKLPAFRQWKRLASIYGPKPERGVPLRVLDVGCGTGGFLKFASGEGYSVSGFDSSAAQVRHAKQSFSTVFEAITCSDFAEASDQVGETYDLVTMWDVLEHLRQPEAALSDILKHMSPGALIYAAVPAGPAMLIKHRLARIFGRSISFSPWEHVFYFSTQSLASYMNRWGFDVITVGAVPCYPRQFSIFELIRRIAFGALSVAPRYSPQIFVLARKPA